MKYFWDSITTLAYWKYALFSPSGLRSVLSAFGAIYLFIEALDFFGLYARDKYASYAFLMVMGVSIVVSTLLRRPLTSTIVNFPQKDFSVEVRIGDVFDASGAVAISTNTAFEADVAGGKIHADSLQGQFTVRYFQGKQDELEAIIQKGLGQAKVDGEGRYPYGTTVPVTTHGKTFYWFAMAELNEQGNASTTPQAVDRALQGLWTFVREQGELQELAIPLIGTGRGRLNTPRNKMIERIAQSFVDASSKGVFSDRLVIVVRGEDAKKFGVNLWEIKDYLERSIVH